MRLKINMDEAKKVKTAMREVRENLVGLDLGQSAWEGKGLVADRRITDYGEINDVLTIVDDSVNIIPGPTVRDLCEGWTSVYRTLRTVFSEDLALFVLEQFPQMGPGTRFVKARWGSHSIIVGLSKEKIILDAMTDGHNLVFLGYDPKNDLLAYALEPFEVEVVL